MINGEELKNTNDYELLMLYREDDEIAKNMLYYKYKYVIDILISKYKRYFINLNIDLQEAYSECAVGFSDALKSYNDSKETSLPTFITLCIERRLNAIIRKYNRDKYKGIKETYSLDFLYEDNDSKLLDFISDDELNDPLKNMTDVERYEELIASLKSSLTKREYEVFVLMSRGFNYQEIAHILKQTPKQVDNARQRVKMKFRKILAVDNE